MDYEMFTEEEIELCQGGWGNNLETAETMLYVRTGLRNLDQLRSDLESSGHDMSDYQTTEEKENATKTEVESKKKVNMKKAKTNKKANISKKASVQLNLEIEDYIELLKDRYESAPADWKTRGGKLLINELYEYFMDIQNFSFKVKSFKPKLPVAYFLPSEVVNFS